MKYDDASWHSEGDYPDDLPPANGATHIGMFLAWAIGRGLVGDLHCEDSAEELEALRDRRLTPGLFLLRCCDGRLTDEDLNETGNAFASRYYAKRYLEDYAGAFADDPGATLYHVADSWANFDRLQPALDRRFERWRAKN